MSASPSSITKGSIVQVDNSGQRRKVLSIRPADGKHDNLNELGCSNGDLIALLGGTGILVVPVSRLSKVF